MAVAGCDYSSKFIDIVKLDEETDAAEWARFPLAGTDAFERARFVRTAMPSPTSTFWDDVLALGIEQPRGNFGVVHVARIQGAILSCLPRSLLVQPHNPAEWRKTVGLPGNADKMQVAGWSLARWTNPPSAAEIKQDACDAYCIALATRMQIQMGAAA